MTEQPFASKPRFRLGRLILKLFLLLIVVLAGLALYVNFLPASYRVTRETVIDAPPEQVYPLVANYKNWPDWSPWAELDPNCEYSYNGPESGVGAVCKWTGNDSVGEGSMTTTEAKANEQMKFTLAFVRPFEDVSQSEFQFTNLDGKTRVTWTMSGEKNYLAKAIDLFIGMEAMIGKDFDKGLAKLKSEVEKPK